jgi:hypothetical protein
MGEVGPRQPAPRVPLGHPALAATVNESVDDAPGFEQTAGLSYTATSGTDRAGGVELPPAAKDVPRESLAERARQEAYRQRQSADG